MSGAKDELVRAFDEALANLTKTFAERCSQADIPPGDVAMVITSSMLSFAAQVAQLGAIRGQFLTAARVAWDVHEAGNGGPPQ
jgi:hypothetical protein